MRRPASPIVVASAAATGTATGAMTFTPPIAQGRHEPRRLPRGDRIRTAAGNAATFQ